MTYQDFTPGTKVKVTGVPARVKDFAGKEIDNPLLGMEGVVTNSQPDDVNVQIDGYGNTGFLPETLEIVETEEQRKEREADARYQKALTEYDKSHFVNVELPVVDGVTVKLETREEYAAKAKASSYYFRREPQLKITFGKHTESVGYETVGGYGNRKKRYQLRHTVTEYKTRNYAKLQTAVEKFKSYAIAYEAEQERKAKHRKANNDYNRAVAEHFAEVLPKVAKHDYRESYHLPKSGYGSGVKISPNRTDGEFNGTYYVEGLGSKLTADQVSRIVAILEENA